MDSDVQRARPGPVANACAGSEALVCARFGRRAGFALSVVLFALFGITALVAGLSFVARLDHGVSVASRDATRALAAAELTAWAALTHLDSSHFQAVRGEELPLPAPPANADSVRATAVRLGDSLFVFVGEAGVRLSGGTFLWRRVGVLGTAMRDTAGRPVVAPLPGRAWFELP